MGLISFLLMGRAEKETSKRALDKDHDPLRWWSGGGASIKAILKKGQPGPETGGWRPQADSRCSHGAQSVGAADAGWKVTEAGARPPWNSLLWLWLTGACKAAFSCNFVEILGTQDRFVAKVIFFLLLTQKERISLHWANSHLRSWGELPD